MSRWVLVGAGLALLVAGTVLLIGYQWGRKSCPQISVAPGAISTPETKPLEPETLKVADSAAIKILASRTGRLEADLAEAHLAGDTWRERYGRLYDSCLAAQGVPSRFTQVFGNRWPHSGDSVAVDVRNLTATLTPFGFVPQQTTDVVQGDVLGVGRRRPLLEIGGIWSFGGSDQLFATIPNWIGSRRLVYTPHRIGVAFQPWEHRWGLALSWQIL